MKFRKMHFVAVMIYAFLITGCTTQATAPSNSAEIVPETKSYVMIYEPASIAILLTETNEIESDLFVDTHIIDEPGYEATIVIYETKEGNSERYAALQAEGGSFVIGQIGYEGAYSYSIEAVEAFGQPFLKVTGSLGANAPITYYISPTTSQSNSSVSLEIGAHSVEEDVDGDGIKEIIATVGTIAETTLYTIENDELASVNLNNLLGAKVVLYEAATNTFQAEIMKGSLSSWRIEGNNIILVQP